MDAGDELGPATKPTDRHGFLPSSPVLHGPAQDGAMHVGVSVRREAKATSRRARACVRASESCRPGATTPRQATALAEQARARRQRTVAHGAAGG
jgi:hypothetical protein